MYTSLMANNNNPKWQDWAILALIVAVVLTNAYWYWMVQDTNKRLDAQSLNIYQLSTHVAQ